MLTGKLGKKLLNETTTNFKWLHVLFINKDLRKDVEYNNVGLAQIMQIWKRNNTLNSDISVTALFALVSVHLWVSEMQIDQHQVLLDIFEQWLLGWIVDMLLLGSVEQADVYL